MIRLTIDYYLNESKGWALVDRKSYSVNESRALDTKELERAIDEARKTCNPRAIVVINPGNPTGEYLVIKLNYFGWKPFLIAFLLLL